MVTQSMTATSRAYWWATLALSGLAAAALCAFLGPRHSLAVMPRPDGDERVLRIAYVQDLQLDPHRRSFPFPVQNQFILSLWEPLIECDPETGQPLPAAAESWIWSEDRLTLTLKLRPDGRWSNGDRVVAGDFVRGWRRLLQQSMDVAGVLYPLKNAAAFHEGKVKPEEVGMEAVDDLTLRLTLAQVRSTWVTELADPLLVPWHEATETVLQGKRYLREPEQLASNGAFRLERASKDGFRVMVSRYYRDRAAIRLAGAEFVRVDNLKLGRLLVATGRVDLTAPLPEGTMAPLPTDRSVKEVSEMALIVSTLDLNTERGPLRDQRVRRALALAMDRAGSLRAPAHSTLVPAYAWVPDMPGRPALTIMNEDVKEARRLLADAGYPGGRSFPVLILPVSPRWRTYTYLQEWTDRWYRELGVRTYLAYQNEEERSRGLKAGAYDIVFNGLIATVPDAGDMLAAFTLPGLFNATGWSDPEVSRLLREADRKTGSERLALLEQVERRVMDAVPTIPTMFERRRTLLANEVEGWYADPLGRQALKRLAIRVPVASQPKVTL
jgi:oligopeptide transport system substrate-binding protein